MVYFCANGSFCTKPLQGLSSFFSSSDALSPSLCSLHSPTSQPCPQATSASSAHDPQEGRCTLWLQCALRHARPACTSDRDAHARSMRSQAPLRLCTETALCTKTNKFCTESTATEIPDASLMIIGETIWKLKTRTKRTTIAAHKMG